MAEKTVLADDLDGTLEAHRCAFTWAGVEYNIDLAGENLTAFEQWHATAARWVEVARPETPTEPDRKISRAHSAVVAAGVDIAVLRAWADDNNVTLPRAGRIPGAVVKRYLAATASPNGVAR